MSKIIRKEQSPTVQDAIAPVNRRSWHMIAALVAFIVCTLMLTNPIARSSRLDASPDISMPKNLHPFALPFITGWGRWLPQDLHLSSNITLSIYRTANIEIIVLVALLVAIYLYTLYFVARRVESEQLKFVRKIVLIGVVVVGLILVVLPGMASKDIFVYADYGNILGRHHQNPYFAVPNLVAPHDALTVTDDWNKVSSAYGPVWSIVTAVITGILGDHPIFQLYGYRMMGLIYHLINIFLIGLILRSTGRSERVVTLGMVFYALCPLTLLESVMGGHNDAFMAVFMLLGILLTIRAGKRGFTRPANYLPALCAFVLATLVKFTSFPLIFIFLIVLAIEALELPVLTGSLGSLNLRSIQLRSLNWREGIKHLLIGGLTCAFMFVLFYGPFFIGHNLGAIARSFSLPPSSYESQNSLMKVAVLYLQGHPGQRGGLPHLVVRVLASHTFWTLLDASGLSACFLLCAWRSWIAPTARTLVLCSLTAMTALLVLTPWFYSWYVIWLVSLAATLFAFPMGRWSRTLLVFVSVFSVSSFATYIDVGLLDHQLLFRYLAMIVPPIVAVLWLWYRMFRVKNAVPQVSTDKVPDASLQNV